MCPLLVARWAQLEGEAARAANAAAREAAKVIARTEAIKLRAERNLSQMDEELTAEELPKLQVRLSF